MRLIRRNIWVILSATTIAIIPLVSSCSKSYQNPYEIDPNNPPFVKDYPKMYVRKVDYQNWMGQLPDFIPIAYMSILGTHDTTSSERRDPSQEILPDCYDYAPIPWQARHDQYLTLRQQLDCGVRAFDIRVDPNGWCIHQPFELNVQYMEVVSTICNFLREHPTEFVELGGSPILDGVIGAGQDKGWEPSIKTKVTDAWINDHDYRSYIWNGSRYDNDTSRNYDKLGDFRGKVIIDPEGTSDDVPQPERKMDERFTDDLYGHHLTPGNYIHVRGNPSFDQVADSVKTSANNLSNSNDLIVRNVSTAEVGTFDKDAPWDIFNFPSTYAYFINPKVEKFVKDFKYRIGRIECDGLDEDYAHTLVNNNFIVI